MIAVDSNLLVYAHREDSTWHEEAESLVRSLSEAGERWALPWPCVHEFLAIVTHPRIYDPPTPARRAVEQVEAWLESPTLVLLGEGEGYWPHVRELACADGWPDRAEDWMNAGAMMNRVNFAQQLAGGRMPGFVRGSIDATTASMVASPAFQRR